MTHQSSALKSTLHCDSRQLELLFNHLFYPTENTRLLGGADEPVYLPADSQYSYHRLFYREDYFASALHEIAHWCIAGPDRRLLEDFGYWYAPDGRNAQQQARFEAVEVKPQALEWIFTEAAGCRFVLSVDNFALDNDANEHFAAKVAQQRGEYQMRGMPERAQQWCSALKESRYRWLNLNLATTLI